MTTRTQALLRLLVIVVWCLAQPARGEGRPPLDRIVAAVAASETAELARLQEAIEAAPTQAEVVRLQGCAAYVKLAGRLALCEQQQELAADPAAKARLDDAVAMLRAQLAARATGLPDSYRYDPLASLEQEVQPCAE